MELNSEVKGLPSDLKKIILTRAEIVIEGKGLISIKDERSIDLTIYVLSKLNFNSNEYINNLLSSHKDAGKVVGDEQYFNLEGISTTGDHFICEKVALYNLNDPDVITGRLHSHLIITNDLSCSDYRIGKIVIPFELKIPTNRAIEIQKNYSNKWKTRSFALRMFETTLDQTDINVLTEKDKTIILIHSKSKIINGLKDLSPVIDSLSFITSSLIDKVDIELANHSTGDSKRIFCHSRMTEKNPYRNFEPLSINSSEKGDYYTELYNRFYSFRQDPNSEELMKCLREIIVSSQSFINVYSLTLTTSIELIAKRYFSTETSQLSSEEILNTKEQIRNLEINDQIKTRIIGLLSNIIGQIRAKDILLELRKKEILTVKEYNAWTKLRNAATHGDNTDDTYQEKLNLCTANLVLFNKLVFNIIDYHGAYTDYSQYGHPTLKIENSCLN